MLVSDKRSWLSGCSVARFRILLECTMGRPSSYTVRLLTQPIFPSGKILKQRQQCEGPCPGLTNNHTTLLLRFTIAQKTREPDLARQPHVTFFLLASVSIFAHRLSLSREHIPYLVSHRLCQSIPGTLKVVRNFGASLEILKCQISLELGSPHSGVE